MNTQSPGAGAAAPVSLQPAGHDHGQTPGRGDERPARGRFKAACVVRSIASVVVVAVILGAAQWKASASASPADSDAYDTVEEFNYLPPQFAFRAIEFDDPVPLF